MLDLNPILKWKNNPDKRIAFEVVSCLRPKSSKTHPDRIQPIETGTGSGHEGSGFLIKPLPST